MIVFRPRKKDRPRSDELQRREVVLYCHITRDHEDRLERIAGDIRNLLEKCDGMLVIYVDKGLKDLLQWIHPIERELSRPEAKKAKQKLKKRLLKRSSKLQEGEDLAEKLRRAFSTESVRVLTSLDLVDVFGEMNDVENLNKFLLGSDGKAQYDSPKFVEAIVRLRMIGSRVPVMRLDEDVLIPAEGEEFKGSDLQAAIQTLCLAMVEHHEATQVLATILSANYKAPDERTETDVMIWNRGYATRILPSLLLPEEAELDKYLALAPARTLGREQKAERSRLWETELQKHFDRRLTRRFLDKAWKWGAPKTAVISGALLCMNDAVVLNVPPFSNFSRKVMWIDDHLRYVLHREMGDFCRGTQLGAKSRKPLNVFYEKQQVTKHRTPDEYLDYALRIYLPSLLWGSFVDRWLCPKKLLKRRSGGLGPKRRDRWEALRKKGAPGVLALAVREARAGCLPDEAVLRRKLEAEADVRLGEVRSAWRGLKGVKSQTIASAWTRGLPEYVVRYLELVGASRAAYGDSEGASKIQARLPGKVSDFNGLLADGFNSLVDDACRYVKWVYEWPRIVSVIRAVPPGEFRSDLAWTKD